MTTTPQNHQDQKDNDGQLLVVTMRRPQRWTWPQYQQHDGGQLLIVATKRPWQRIRSQYNENHKGDDG